MNLHATALSYYEIGGPEATSRPQVLALRLLRQPAADGASRDPAELSDREKEILEQVALGLKNIEIARRLFVSPKTVRNHVSNILSKLQVADRTQAALKAIEAGLAAPKERRA
ncbi:MAG TPA: response regulator transcription factor [Burkholderiales bacterium]|jgi:DNA-binding NarL/FixJ family response regulator|nr:response regulator transcription factor [Burkholderiales bacterium]